MGVSVEAEGVNKLLGERVEVSLEMTERERLDEVVRS